MKKLLFLVPAAFWSVTYFTFPYATQENPNGLWWLFTNLLLICAAIGSLVHAVASNHPDL